MSDKRPPLTPSHDTRCEREHTQDGHVFIDCLCHIRLAKAEAWDEGYMACYDFERGASYPESDNPYRTTEEAK